MSEVTIALTRHRKFTLICMILGGTILGLAGIDLVLPAIPSLAQELHGTPVAAQWVLASFVAGSGLGLLLFGELGARFDQRKLLIFSLFVYGLLSLLAILCEQINWLIVLRFFQGLAGSAAAVFAPGMIRALLSENRAIAALGAMGSIESLTPALAPILGAWLLAFAGWQASFTLLTLLSVVLIILWLPLYRLLPGIAPLSTDHHYGALLKNRRFLRLAFSQAFTLGALLTFVFAAPALMVGALAGGIQDFVIMQIIGVGLFICAASSSHLWVAKFGQARMINTGTWLTFIGAALLLIYAIVMQLIGSVVQAAMIWALFAIVNLGLGVRGPPGFFAAIQAAGSDSARASALIILLVMLTAALGTALAAPWLSLGLLPIAALVTLIAGAAVLCLERQPING
ncbi:MFS transporter [Halioxenophilus sp. WMMB6]|uniref:MFS transporter n=1 Tax=Halioxenophilus sp. WMMB6 TaxID=3073815 RepID=UPI00295EAE22|nr:MFS transporter [Halioxenophilus sp. WMMB6]